MPQDSHHPLYDKRLPQWQRCRDAMEGTDAIKARGETYLPRPSGMTDAEYRAYRTRATWFNASHRTLEGYVGMAFRLPPVITVPDVIRARLANVTGTGLSLEAFAAVVFEQILCTGHGGMLLDLPLHEQVANAVAPQWAFNQAEQIINWQVEPQADGTMALTRVMLEETLDEWDPADNYKHQAVTQWRELILLNGVYTVLRWQRSAGSVVHPMHLVEPPIVPNRMKQPLKFIPFDMDFLGASMPPPLLDIVDMNLSHYRTSADYEHDLHMTCMKTPWIIADCEFKAPLKLGGLEAIHIQARAQDAAIGMLEPNGDSLQAKLDKLNAAEQQMAVLGARLLEPQKRAVEAAETLAIRQSGEQSVLQDMVQTMSQRLTRVLRWHVWWAGVTETPDDSRISVQLNTDLMPTRLSPQELEGLVAAWQGGAITQEGLHYQLQQGEMLPPEEKDFATWAARLATQGPALLGRPGLMKETGAGTGEKNDAS